MNIGIDLGLQATAVVRTDDGEILEEVQFGTYNIKKFKKAVNLHPYDRYRKYADKLEEVISSCPCTIIMEDPMGTFNGNAIKIAELKGVYLITLGKYVPSSKIFLPKASEIKRFFTGKGNATKEEMIAECIKRGYKPASDHLADAYAMSLMK